VTSRSATGASERSSKADEPAHERAWIWFGAVGSILFLAQVALTDLGRAPGWDEAIYLSQVDPDVPTLPFAASRARGIVVLVAPLVAAGLPLTAIRAVLALGSSAALVAAAAAWRPIVGTRIAAAAAATIGGTWLVLFSGAEVMPNLWSAIALLGVCGLFARGLAAGWYRQSWPTLALLAGAAVMRPLDAVVVAVVLAVVSMRRDADLWWPLGVLGATLAGALPWLVEMSIRFGGPVGAVGEALAVGHVEGGADIVETTRLHLALADGPLIGPDAGPIPVPAALWWLAVLWLAGWYGRRAADPARLGALVGFACGLGLLLVYLVGVDGGAPRFLLPAIALLTMAAAAGVTALERPGQVAVGIAAAAWIAIQVSWLATIHDETVAARAAAASAGQTVRELAGHGDCLIVTTDDAPQLGYASGCRVRWVRGDETLRLPEEGPVFSVLGPSAPVRPGTSLGNPVVLGRYLIYPLEDADTT
jgi:hypothetical protein